MIRKLPGHVAVYILDDDEAVRDSLQWLLEGKDYRSGGASLCIRGALPGGSPQ